MMLSLFTSPCDVVRMKTNNDTPLSGHHLCAHTSARSTHENAIRRVITSHISNCSSRHLPES